jgi:serine/threonine protein kinase/Flp pilus assembly protein TadD
MAAAWARGEPIAAEDLIARHPGLDAAAAIRLIYEEVCLRREAGQPVSTAEVISRFPQWHEELEVLFGCDRLLQPRAAAVFPEVGETLGPYRLLAELGRGAAGRTFLASEPALADRPIVLKIVSCDYDEHLRLARLQHTHIVPLFSEQAFPERGLRTLCMPYLGGASLGQVLTGLAAIAPGERRGSHVVEALDRNQRGPLLQISAESPYRRFLEQASYVQAVCWIAACLADALHHAHVRGLVHMDLKPSNVLLAEDGQPMLLDFHLARDPIAPGDWVAGRLGGTPGWMSPEQSAALEAVGRGEPVGAAVDVRSDLYAVGLLMREALAGPAEVIRGAGAGREGLRGTEEGSWLRRNPEVSVGLGDLVEKCLACEPSERYRDAAALAEDLRRHLNDLPLRGVANRSAIERWRKWRRRRPGILARRLAWTSMAGALAIAAVLIGTVYQQRGREIQTDLEDGRRLSERQHHAEAIQVLRRGLDRARSLPAFPSLTRALSRQFRMAERGQKAVELHELADLIRFRYGLSLPGDNEARALARHCRTVWDQRSYLLPSRNEPLTPGLERQIKTDLLELAIVWAELRVRPAAPGDEPDARRDALSILDEAETALGSSLALERRRHELGLRHQASASPTSVIAASTSEVRSSWDHYDLGRSYLREGRITAAAAEFQQVLNDRPQDFWSNFYEGLCAFQLGQFEESLAAFRTCAALCPGVAACYHNRALAYEALGRSQAALSDYSHALSLDPTLTAARLNRGIILYRNGRLEEAIRDFQHALALTPEGEAQGRIHFNLALVHQAQGTLSLALDQARKATLQGCTEAAALAEELQRVPRRVSKN